MIDLSQIQRRWQLPAPDAWGRVSLGNCGYIAAVDGRLAFVVTGSTPPQWLLPPQCRVPYRTKSGATIFAPAGYAGGVLEWLSSTRSN